MSYAHEDSDLVYAEIRRLTDEGFHVWFDEGISPGSRWSDDLATSLERSALFLYFATPNSVGSQHCQDEINLALDAGKPTIAVHLAETSLTPGLRLRLSSHQAILKYELTDQDYMSKLLAAIGAHVDQASVGPNLPSPPRTSTVGTKPILLAGGLVALAIVVGALVLRPAMESTPNEATGAGDMARATATEAGAGPAFARPAIAVLPFENLSAHEDNVYFAAGFHDHTLSTLAKIKTLKVISRTSVLPYAGSGKSISAIGEELDVGFILEGSVQRTAESMRITVQLINAGTDEHIWAETYDRSHNASNVFAIQSDVATKIAAALEAELSPEDEARLASVETDSTEALHAYLRGRQAYDRLNCRDTGAAARHFQQAINLDPEYAAAFAGLALAHSLTGMFCGASPAEWIPKMRAATDRAFELDPTSGQAHVARAALAWWTPRQSDSDLTESFRGNIEATYRLAIELSPNYPIAYEFYAMFLRDNQRYDEALVQQRKVLELNPQSVSIVSYRGRDASMRPFQH